MIYWVLFVWVLDGMCQVHVVIHQTDICSNIQYRLDISKFIEIVHTFICMHSYRQLNVMDETYVINQVKEDACFTSQNFNSDMAIARSKKNTILRDYVLPDFTTIKRGYVRSLEESTGKSTAGEQVGLPIQVIYLTNRLFTLALSYFL